MREIVPDLQENEWEESGYISDCNEEEMINIRRGEYPGWDSYGTYWYDPSGMHTDVAGNCFICGTSTYRLDIDFHAHFCNQTECNDEVRRQLEEL
jgi:hypothetical protein